MSRIYVLVFVCFCACLSMAFGAFPDKDFPPNCTNNDNVAVIALAKAVKAKVPTVTAAHSAACKSSCNARKCHNRLAQVNHDKGCLNVSNLFLKNLDLRNFDEICVLAVNLTINDTLRLGDGLNCVFLDASVIQKLEGGSDEDDVFAYGNTSITITDLKDGNDVFSLNGGNLLDINLGKGNDSLYLHNVYVRDVNGSDGNDDIYLNSGYIHNLLGGKGDDTAFLTSDAVEAVNLGYGRDVLVVNSAKGTAALVNDPDEGLIVYDTTNPNGDYRVSLDEFNCPVPPGSF